METMKYQSVLKMKPSAAIFDLDGTLLDSERIFLDSFVETRRFFSLSDCPELYLRCVGLNGCISAQIIREGIQEFVAFDSFVREWDARFGSYTKDGIPLKEGAKELLVKLTSACIPMGIATSRSTMQAQEILKKSGVLKHFQHIVGSDMVLNDKPKPDTYLEVSRLLGVEISLCAAFEDSDIGTESAVASGAITVQIPDLAKPSNATKELGHVISGSLIEGATQIGLI